MHPMRTILPSVVLLAACNKPPGAPTVSIAPDSPVTTDELQVVILGESVDPDGGDELSYTIAWYQDGLPREDLGDTVPASETTRGERWSVVVTPFDGSVDGSIGEAETFIVNSAPVVPSVTLGPEPALPTDVLVASAETPTDADGDPVALSWSWRVNGTEVAGATTDSLESADLVKHDEVVAVATADDGIDSGAPVSSNTLVIANTAPQVLSASIDPTDPVESSTLSCNGSGWYDADGDPEGYALEWSVNGVLVESSLTLDGLHFDKGDVVSCSAAPDDGEAVGEAVESEAVVIGNSAPTVGAAMLSTTSPTEGDTLSVSLVGAVDDDGDSISYTYAWFVDGRPAATSATVSGAEYSRGQEVYVDVTPWDGEVYGATVRSDVATVQNAAPSVSSVELSPDPVRTDDTLSASIVSADLDGDAVAYTYEWSVNGSLVSTAATLSGSLYFSRGDEITLTVTPSDASDSGSPVTSAALTVANSPPVGLVIALNPSAPGDDDELVCAIDTAATDPDGDTVITSLSWTLNGASFTRTGTTFLTGDTVDAGETTLGDVFVCSGTTSDGTDSGSGDSDSATIGCTGCGPEGDYYLVAPDLSMEGVGEFEAAGWAVAMGDVDGDGLADAIVGAHRARVAALLDAGRVYVVSGGTTGSMSLGSADGILSGSAAYSDSGYALASGDLDGDGVDDLVIGAPGASSTFLVLGPVASGGSLSAADAVLTGSDPYSVGVGDFDGDGAAEAVTADYTAGMVYVSPLPAGGSSTVSGAASFSLSGETSGDYAGRWVSGGDTNGDGLDDLLIGASNDRAGGTTAGAAYLVLGGASGSLSLSAADCKLVGESGGDAAGRMLAMGDIDGDGLSDLVIGAPGVSTRESEAGAVYVVSGSSAAGTVDLSTAEAKVWGAGSGTRLSYERSLAAGDLNRDGHDDIVVGNSDYGAIQLFYGPLSGSIESSTADAMFYEESSGTGATTSGLALGDADGDGALDLLIGGYLYSPSGSALYAGKAWLFTSGS